MSQTINVNKNAKGEKKKLVFTTSKGTEIETSPKPADPLPTQNKPLNITPSNTQQTTSQKSSQSAKSNDAQIKVIKVEKPQTTQIKISLNQKNQYDLETMKNWKHKVRLTDEKFIELESNLKRYESKRPSGQKPAPLPKAEIIKRDIRQNLNKLTMEKFPKIYDKITDHPSFHNKDYLEILADLIHEQAMQQKLFSNLYSLFVGAILQALNEKDTEQYRTDFLKRIQDHCCQTLEGPIPDLADSVLTDEAFCHATYYGCLAYRSFINLEEVFRQITKLIELNNPIGFCIIAKILVPCGKLLEEKIPNFSQVVIPPLKAISSNKEVPGHLRYFIIDVLDARDNQWNTSELMDQVYDKRNAASGKASIYSSLGANNGQTNSGPKISAGENQFAYLLNSDDDDDDDEDEEIPFNGRQMVREWINDGEINSDYNPQLHISSLITGLIVGSTKEIPKALTIFDQLKIQEKFNIEETIEALSQVVLDYSTEEFRKDFPSALSYAATIIAYFVNSKECELSTFNKVFVQPEMKSIIAFLDKLNDDSLNIIAEDKYWQSNEWKPKNVTEYSILMTLPESVISFLTFYDNLNAVYGLIVQDESEEVSPPEAIASQIAEETPAEILSMKEFALGTIEILLEETDDPNLISAILPVLKAHEIEMMSFVENYGKVKKGLTEQKLADFIKSIAKAGNLNIGKFKTANLGPEHAAIAAFL